MTPAEMRADVAAATGGNSVAVRTDACYALRIHI